MTINLDNLGQVACDAATRSALEYLRRHLLEVDNKALADALNVHVKARLPEALDDAKEALAEGMGQMATATFLASMQLAGIDAAKEVQNG